MKKLRILFLTTMVILVAVSCVNSPDQAEEGRNTTAESGDTIVLEDKDGKIIHSVAFILKHEAGSDAEAIFLRESWERLAVIPGVEDFTISRLTSEKNPYDFELEMKFADQNVYDAYNSHPNHYDLENETGYVPELWFNEVEDFLEKDTVVLLQSDQTALKNGFIHHTVAFKLLHEQGSPEESLFLQEAWDRLSVIPGVLNFTVSRQTSPKNPYDFELTMDFANQEDYDAYNVHPNHYDQENETGFVPELWFNEVDIFLEKDGIIFRDAQDIIHSVAFKLVHEKESEEEARFLQASWDMLSVIPGVMDYTINRQTSIKNPYDFELEMKFEDYGAYAAYNSHPNHFDQEKQTGFVPELWFNEVEDFLEKDTEVIMQAPESVLGSGSIHHTVAFTLVHTSGSPEEELFLQEAWDRLSVIPGVLNFTVSRQTSQKNPYDFELTMDFADQEDYDAYNVHPNHFDQENNTGFVPELWFNEVSEFLEKDTVSYKD